MSGDGDPCDDRGVLVDKLDRVDEYQVNAHTFKFDRLAGRCPRCAKDYETLRAFGESDERAPERIRGTMFHLHGELMIMRWLQGDEPRIVALVQRSPLVESADLD